MSDSGAQITPLGAHSLRIDGDTLELHASGPIKAEDMRGLYEHFIRIKREHGMLFVFYDGRNSAGIESDARRIASQTRSNDADANLRVAFGVSFAVRVVLSMVIRAQKMLANRDVNLAIFETEEEARTHFIAEREKVRARIKAAKSL